MFLKGYIYQSCQSMELKSESDFPTARPDVKRNSELNVPLPLASASYLIVATKSLKNYFNKTIQVL